MVNFLPEQMIVNIVAFLLEPVPCGRYCAWLCECPYDHELKVQDTLAQLFYDKSTNMLCQCVRRDIPMRIQEDGTLVGNLTDIDPTYGGKNGHWIKHFELNTKVIENTIRFYQYGAVMDDETTMIGHCVEGNRAMTQPAFNSFFAVCRTHLELWSSPRLPKVEHESGDCRFKSITSIVPVDLDEDSYQGMGPCWLIFTLSTEIPIDVFRTCVQQKNE